MFVLSRSIENPPIRSWEMNACFFRAGSVTGGAAPGVNSTEWQVAGDASEVVPLQRDRRDCKWAWPGTHITIFYLSKCFSIHSNLKWSNMVIFCSKNFKKNVAM
jgi:hypothetical protein